MWVIILLGLVLAAPRLAGIKTYAVISGSMEPAIPVGSMVYSKEVDPKTLETGDVIVFYNSNTTQGDGSTAGIIPVTHRVVLNDTGLGEITTKGDANEQRDISKVTYNNVEGKVIFHIPHLGYIGAPLSTTMGKVAAALILLAGYLLTEVGGSIRKRS
ncbi:MAG: signal peptidase I [Mogibacterium sp.]|nr:signal peptidase I [Mogibacterium sp.]